MLLGDGPDTAVMLTLGSEGSETPTTDRVAAAATVPLSRRLGQSPGAMKEKEVNAKEMKVIVAERTGSPSGVENPVPSVFADLHLHLSRWSALAPWRANLILSHRGRLS